MVKIKKFTYPALRSCFLAWYLFYLFCVLIYEKETFAWERTRKMYSTWSGPWKVRKKYMAFQAYIAKVINRHYLDLTVKTIFRSIKGIVSLRNSTGTQYSDFNSDFLSGGTHYLDLNYVVSVPVNHACLITKYGHELSSSVCRFLKVCLSVCRNIKRGHELSLSTCQ